MVNIKETYNYIVEPEDCTQFYTSAQGTTLAPGAFLDGGNYRLEKKLGEGGMAQVWLATEISGGRELRKVVCKLLPRPVQMDSRSLEQIEKVFALTQGLNHHNICPIYGMKSDPTFGWFFVMAYADGPTLEKWFRAQPNAQNGLPLPKVLEILEPLASALDYAHKKGIIHRDVKPQNVMFTGDDQTLWLLDFGIASRIHSTMTATVGARASSGTPHFMAPEQCKSEPQDERTDQYALATLAYFLLSGHTPFEGDLFALWGQIVGLPPQPIPQVSSLVNSALLRALSKDRHVRFATCGEFVRTLLEGNPVSSVLSHPKTMEELQQEFYEKLKAEEAERERVVQAQRLAQERLEAEKRAKEEEARKIAEAQRLAQERLEAEKRAKEEEARKIAEAQRLAQERLEAEKREAGKLFIRKADRIEYRFRWCPAGTFMMGTKGGFFNLLSDETSHKVTLTKGFWMLETPVTQAMWESVMGTKPSNFVGSDLPVEQVNWPECQEFCQKLTSRLGGTVSLPTEAQWEYACRAGTTEVYAGKLDKMAWYRANSDQKTHSVGKKQANAWGLYDMHGNIWEWCEDWYDLYVNSPTDDPRNLKAGPYRISRGGSWNSASEYCRSAYRNYNSPIRRLNYLGFRVIWQEK